MSRRDVETARAVRVLSAKVARIERALGPKLQETLDEMDAEIAFNTARGEHTDKVIAQGERCERADVAAQKTAERADQAAKDHKGAKPLVRKYKDRDDLDAKGKAKEKEEKESAKDFEARKAQLERAAEECAHEAEQAAGHFEAMVKRMEELEKSKPKLDDFLPKPEKAGKKTASEQ